MAIAPIVKNINDLSTHRIAPGDTVKLVHVTGPSEGSPTSVFFEIWDPKGSQPDNSHPDSVEIFIILSGTGSAASDEHTFDLTAGDVLVLPRGSAHHIRTTSETERLYAVTIMSNDLGAMDKGFESLVTTGVPEVLESVDVESIFTGLAALGVSAKR